jgi:hypothetical protein
MDLRMPEARQSFWVQIEFFCLKHGKKKGMKRTQDLPATLDEHFVSTHTAVTSVLAAFSGMIAPPKGEKPRLR